LHPEPRGDDLDRLSARRDPDAVRPRDRGFRPDLPGDDLEALHGARAEVRAVPEGVPRGDTCADLEVAQPAVRDERRVLLPRLDRALLPARPTGPPPAARAAT